MNGKLLPVSAGLIVAAACASVALAQVPPTPPQEPGARAFSMAFGGNFLGIYTEEITRENMNRYGLAGEPRGVGVNGVVENSPAAKAGVQKGDVILAYDGERVASARKLRRLVEESSPDHAARLTVSRGGGERELTATLSRPDALGAGALRLEGGELFRRDGKEWQRQSTEETRRQAEEMRKQAEALRGQLEKFRGQGGGDFAFAFHAGRRVGVTTTPLTDQLADYFGVGREGGVLVTSVTENSPAAKAGLKAGDIITEVDGEHVRSAADLARLVGRKDDGDVTLTVTRERGRRTFKVTPEKSPAPTTWAFPEGLFTAPGAALALPRGGFVVRPSIIAAPRSRLLRAPSRVVPATPLRVRPVKSLAPARGQLLEL
jgi:serine protease Do